MSFAPSHIEAVTPGDLHPLRRTVLGWSTLEHEQDHQPDAHHCAAVAPQRHIIAGASCGPAPCPHPELRNLAGYHFWGVAVLPDVQGQGHGALVLEQIVATAVDAGAQVLWANARESAISYYATKGFEVVGEPFTDLLSGLIDRMVVRHLP